MKPRSENFAAIDLQLGGLLRRLATSHAELLEVSAALVSRERGRGHSCLVLDAEAGRAHTLGERQVRLPALAAWRDALASSELVALAGARAEQASPSPRPLVLDAEDRLYLWRYWAAEQRIAQRLGDLAATPAGDTLNESAAGVHEAVSEDVAALWRRLFPRAAEELDWQAAAAATALSSPLTLISGGPGTGKTTTVVRLLALLRAAEPDLRVALAAPTGKAAARLEEAIAEQLSQLDEKMPDAAIRELVGPVEASTLHRLLAYSPSRDRFGRHRRRPLTCGLLVVDEASMVDLLMMHALLDALPASARLVLLGDRDQLASVETGFVFGDLCTAAGLHVAAEGAPEPTLRRNQREIYTALGGTPELPGRAVPVAPAMSPPLAGCGVELQISYRFRHRPGIGVLATALRRSDAPAALRALDAAEHAEVRRLDPPPAARTAIAPLHGAVDRYLESQAPEEALAALDTFRILCARRRGPWGTQSLNAAVEAHLARRGYLDPASGSHRGEAGFYRGQPILVEANDYSAQLFNGDLGVCWGDGGKDSAAGGLWVFFRSPEGLRRVALAKLPRHSTAWAMTVHKAQGTELDHVLLVLGDDDPGGLVSRELLYTGVTRARREVDVVATPALLRAAVRRTSRRTTGLAEALVAAGK